MPAPAMNADAGRLRIALPTGIFPPDIGGPASYVPRIADALAARGHAVEVLTLADDPAGGGSYSFPVRRIRRGMARIPRMIQTIAAIAASARKADLIYANGLFIEAAISAAIAGKPLVMKIVGDWAWERARNRGEEIPSVEEFQSRRQSPRSEAVKWLRTRTTQRADAVITPSRYLKTVVAGWGIPERKIEVVYNALETPPETEAVRMPPFDGTTLVTVARLVAWKGIDVLVELIAERKDWRLLVIGDGPERRNLEAHAIRMGVAERVIFTGGLPRGQVFAHMKAADVFVLNSLYEGLPHIILEAFAAGLPVVAASAGGTIEVVEDGVNGLLVPTRRKDLLSAAVGRLIAQPGLRSALIEGARRTLQRLLPLGEDGGGNRGGADSRRRPPGARPMNVLMIGLGDAGLDQSGSEPVRRHLEYARRIGGHIDLVVDSPAGGTTDFGALTVHRTGTGRMRFPAAAYRLALAASKKNAPDLITTQDPFATALAGLWLRRSIRRPLLIQNHSCFLFNPHWIAERPVLFRAYHLLARYALPRADAWRVVNTAEREIYIRKLGLPGSRVRVLPVPCDLEVFSKRRSADAIRESRNRRGLPPGTPVIAWAGRPVRFKDSPYCFRPLP